MTFPRGHQSYWYGRALELRSVWIIDSVKEAGSWNKPLTQTQRDEIYWFILELNQMLNFKLKFYVLSNVVYLNLWIFWMYPTRISKYSPKFSEDLSYSHFRQNTVTISFGKNTVYNFFQRIGQSCILWNEPGTLLSSIVGKYSEPRHLFSDPQFQCQWIHRKTNDPNENCKIVFYLISHFSYLGKMFY